MLPANATAIINLSDTYIKILPRKYATLINGSAQSMCMMQILYIYIRCTEIKLKNLVYILSLFRDRSAVVPMRPSATDDLSPSRTQISNNL